MNEYWLEKWNKLEIGFHQPETSHYLKAHAGVLGERSRVLVPLSGKTLDLIFLRDRGHDVIACELSPIACEGFFDENRIHYEKSKQGAFTIYRSHPRITVFCGDFFELSPALTGPIEAAWDRAALVALPPELRPSYVRCVLSLLGGELGVSGPKNILLSSLDYPDGPQGPPFSVTHAEIERLYAPAEVEKLDSRFLDDLPRRNPKFAETQVRETAYRIKLPRADEKLRRI